MAEYAHNPQTGERYVLEGGKWRKLEGAELAAAETGPLKAMAVGAGRGTTQIGRTLQRGYYQAKDLIGALLDNTFGEPRETPELDALQAQGFEESQLYAPLQEQRPISSFAGEVVPGVAAGPAGRPLRAAGTRAFNSPVAGVAVEQAALGAFLGATQADEATLENMAFGGGLGLAGYLGGNLTGRAVSGIRQAGRDIQEANLQRQAARQREPGGDARYMDVGEAEEYLSNAQRGQEFLRDMPTPEETPQGLAEIVADAERLGMKMTKGASTGSATARRIEAGLTSSPWTAPEFDKISAHNNRVVTRLAGKAIGLGDQVSELTPATLAKAADDLAEEFGRYAQRVQKVDMQDPEIQGLYRMMQRKWSESAVQEPAINAVFKRLGQRAQKEGTIPAEVLMGERSRAVKAMQGANRRGDYLMAEGYQDVVEFIDESMTRQMIASGTDKPVAQAAAEGYAQARQKWRVLASLEQSVTEAGEVRPLGLYNRLRRDYGTSWFRGLQGERFGADFGNLAAALRVAKTMQPIVGDSGTASRLAMQDLTLGNVGRRASSYLVGQAYLNAPEAVAEGAVEGSRGLWRGFREGGEPGGTIGGYVGRALIPEANEP